MCLLEKKESVENNKIVNLKAKYQWFINKLENENKKNVRKQKNTLTLLRIVAMIKYAM